MYSHETQEKKYTFMLFLFECQRDCIPSCFCFRCQRQCPLKKYNLTAIAIWRGEVRQAHPDEHFGYSKHGQGNAAVVQMDDKKDGRGHQWVGIGYTASSRCTTD